MATDAPLGCGCLCGHRVRRKHADLQLLSGCEDVFAGRVAGILCLCCGQPAHFVIARMGSWLRWTATGAWYRHPLLPARNRALFLLVARSKFCRSWSGKAALVVSR